MIGAAISKRFCNLKVRPIDITSPHLSNNFLYVHKILLLKMQTLILSASWSVEQEEKYLSVRIQRTWW